jgi:hypothetical protein
MPRASSLLGVAAILAIATAARAVELPVIINGTQVVKAAKVEQAPANQPQPVIINYASLFSAPPAERAADARPTIVNLAPAPAPAPGRPVLGRAVLPYTIGAIADDVDGVAYNAYCFGPALSLCTALSCGTCSPFAYWPDYYGGNGFGYGYGCGYGCGGGGCNGGYPWAGYCGAIPWGPWGFGWWPPKVEILDTGVRPNLGRLTSMPSVCAPVYGSVVGVAYYRR